MTASASLVAARRRVMSSFRVPAYADLGLISGDRTVRFLISTKKVGETVLLEIEDVEENPKETQ